MTLVCYHNVNHKEYQEEVLNLFGIIENKKVQKEKACDYVNPFDHTNLGKLVKMKGTEKEKMLSLQWYFEEQ